MGQNNDTKNSESGVSKLFQLSKMFNKQTFFFFIFCIDILSAFFSNIAVLVSLNLKPSYRFLTLLNLTHEAF